jgi:hypothetical protein
MTHSFIRLTGEDGHRRGCGHRLDRTALATRLLAGETLPKQAGDAIDVPFPVALKAWQADLSAPHAFEQLVAALATRDAARRQMEQ